jgi:heme/copper-type cytochrome/quinol oxidase subunit 2
MNKCGGHYIVNDDQIQSSQKDTSSTNNKQQIPKNKKLKFLMIAGVILLIIGLIMASIGLFTITTAKKVDELKNDIDSSTNTFKSYDKGDSLIITGKIITIIETKYIIANGEDVPDKVLIEQFGGKYIYILEKNLEIYANEKIGEIGDKVYLSCEVQKIDKNGREEEILKANPSFNVLLITGAGFVILILGIITIFVVKRRKTALTRAVSKPTKIAELYEAAQIDDEEVALYQFMQKKDKTALAQQNQTKPEPIPGTLFSSQFQDDRAPQPTFQELPTIDPMKSSIPKAQPTTSPLPILQPKSTSMPAQRTPTIAQPLTSPRPAVQPKPISGPTQRTPTLAQPVTRTPTISQPSQNVGLSKPSPNLITTDRNSS